MGLDVGGAAALRAMDLVGSLFGTGEEKEEAEDNGVIVVESDGESMSVGDHGKIGNDEIVNAAEDPPNDINNGNDNISSPSEWRGGGTMAIAPSLAMVHLC